MFLPDGSEDSYTASIAQEDTLPALESDQRGPSSTAEYRLLSGELCSLVWRLTIVSGSQSTATSEGDGFHVNSPHLKAQ